MKRTLQFYRVRYWLLPTQKAVVIDENDKNDLYTRTMLKPNDIEIDEKLYKIRILDEDSTAHCTYGQLARETVVKRHQDNSHQIIDEDDIDNPYVLFLADTRSGKQFLYIQRDSSSVLFRDPKSLVDLLEKITYAIMKDSGLLVQYKLVNKESHFWDAMHEFEKIHQVKFSYLPTNFSTSNLPHSVQDLVDFLKDDTNSNRTTMKLENETDGLQIDENSDFIKESVERTDTVAGDWSIKGILHSGSTKTARKTDYAETYVVGFDNYSISDPLMLRYMRSQLISE